MSATYQFGANPQIDYPRLLIADTDTTAPIFQDSEILAMYNICVPFIILPAGGTTVNAAVGTASYRFVAAGLLDCLASNKARLASILNVLDVKIDASSAAPLLRAQAKALRDADNQSGSFAIAEMVPNQFAARERVWKQLLRIDN